MLLAKAAEDAATLRLLVEHEQAADSALGFHAQQAVEKSLKAVLSSLGVAYARRHDLDYLAELLAETRAELPLSADQIVWLTPWAAVLRYDIPVATEPLDRERAIHTVRVIYEWAEQLITQPDP